MEYRADSDFVAIPDSPDESWRSQRNRHEFYGRALGAIGILLSFIGLAWIATSFVQNSGEVLIPTILIVLGLIFIIGGVLYFRRSSG